MPRNYRRIKEYKQEIMRLRANGFSGIQICEKLGFTIKQYKNFITRHNNNQKKIDAGISLKRKQGVLYLSIIKDLFDSSIVSYKTSTTQNNRLVLDTVRMAKRKEKVTAELQLHSDQGFQYTSQAYFKLTKSYGIVKTRKSI